jgi:nitroreductase
MEFQDIVRRRRMVRQFAPQAVPNNSIERIAANTVRGPSAGLVRYGNW